MLFYAKLGGLAVVILGLLWVGNTYGPNGRWRVNREAEDAARNAALEYITAQEERMGPAIDAAAAVANREFSELAVGLPECIADPAQANALNVIKELR